MTAEFSVYQFFDDGTRECVRGNVSAEEAVFAAKHYTESVGAQLGSTVRVIITADGNLFDSIVFDWRRGEGIVFPTREQCEAARRAEEADSG